MSDTATTDAQATSDAESGTTETQDVSELPQWAQDQLAKARKDAAGYRTKLREAEPLAKQAQELLDAQKTEAEKAADRIVAAEAEVASVPSKVADALRVHLVELHEIDKDDAELFLTATDPDLLLKQVTRLLAQSGTRKRNGNVVPTEGKTAKPTATDERAFVRELFGAGG